MNTEIFVANRLLKSSSKKITKPILLIAIGGIALGICVMIVSVAIVTGFKSEITNKVVGFGAHIRINSFTNNNSYEETPISVNQKFIDELRKNSRIKSIQAYATKAGIIKTKDEIQGIILKGIDKNYDPDFFSDKLIAGALPDLNDTARSLDVLISNKTASLLKLKTGDAMVVYFIQQPTRVRKFKICGIYQTGLEEFDSRFAFCDLRNIVAVNDWRADEVGGFEITLKNFDDLEMVNEQVYKKTGYEFNTQTIVEQYPQIFNWLALQDVNVIIILFLMVLVSGINMISTLLIIILENNTLIAIMKTLGASNKSIRKIFLYLSAWIIGIGLLTGNVLGIGLCLLQKYFHFVKLPEESYYISYVPVQLSLPDVLLINLGTFIVCLLILIIPSYIISRMVIAKSLRFD
ncbi:MAG TPA: ABC transporter permease [Bacteroidia bacterium]|nr:ABC transporter permease [Bacteroidia bacterium]HNU32721.1 ABC transporter permease [Bacteroidia bacterium]